MWQLSYFIALLRVKLNAIMKPGLIILYSWLCCLGLAQVTSGLNVALNLETAYSQGQEATVNFVITLDDDALELEQGVLFLNIVERDAAGKNPQAAHKIFASAKETPSVFRTVYTGAELRAGVETSLSFQLRETAKIADYSLVVQLYRGAETNPNRVKYANRLALKGFNFSIKD